MSNSIMELVQFGNTLDEKSVVYALSLSLPESLLHADNYVGVASGCLLADNYEAYMGYFPIV